jgi:hypothetical protein
MATWSLCKQRLRRATRWKIRTGIQCDSCIFLIWLALARMPDGENLAIKMLDIVTDDFRDGLFLACYRIRTPRIFNKLERCFLEWIAADVTWGQGTGEIYCLKKFIDLWQELKVPFNQRLKDFVIEDAKRWGYPVPWESESTGEGMV